MKKATIKVQDTKANYAAAEKLAWKVWNAGYWADLNHGMRKGDRGLVLISARAPRALLVQLAGEFGLQLV